VEDFGALALEPRAFACGHDGDGEVWGGHRPLWSHVRFWAALEVWQRTVPVRRNWCHVRIFAHGRMDYFPV
jgi:hypothetical protein